MDYAPSFQMGHPGAFELASRIGNLAPEGLDTVFFCQFRLRSSGYST